MKKLLLSVAVLLVNGTVFAQWTAQSTGFSATSRGLVDIEVVSPQVVWGLAYDGAAGMDIQEFTRTTNGGTTWTPGIIDVGNAAWRINNLCPVNATTAWVSAIDLTGGTNAPTPGGIWKTTDGGLSWVQQNSSAFVGTGSFINGVYFWDANEGFAFGDPILNNKIECYKTTDGGATWTTITTVPTMVGGASAEYNYNNGNVFVGNSIWLPTNKGKILRSTDKGATWAKLNSPLSDFGSAAVNGRLYFSDANNGVLLGTTDSGSTYKLYTTSNGGISWVTPAGNYAGGFNRILSYIPGTTTIVATGISATSPAVPGSSYSSNNGTSFTQIDTGTQRGAVTFINGTTGWCSGFTASPSSGGVFKYTGAALSNEVFTAGSNMIAFPNPTSGSLQIQAEKGINQVNVYDVLGKQVFTKNFNAVTNADLDLSALGNGAYILKATSESGIQSIKIMKN